MTAQDIASYLARNPETASIGVAQVRTALKVAAKRGEVIRLERGRYRWPEVSAPNRADEVSSESRDGLQPKENEPPTSQSNGSDTDGEGADTPDPSKVNP